MLALKVTFERKKLVSDVGLTKAEADDDQRRRSPRDEGAHISRYTTGMQFSVEVQSESIKSILLWNTDAAKITCSNGMLQKTVIVINNHKMCRLSYQQHFVKIQELTVTLQNLGHPIHQPILITNVKVAREDNNDTYSNILMNGKKQSSDA